MPPCITEAFLPTFSKVDQWLSATAILYQSCPAQQGGLVCDSQGIQVWGTVWIHYYINDQTSELGFESWFEFQTLTHQTKSEISELSELPATGVRMSSTGSEKIGNVLWEIAILKFQDLISGKKVHVFRRSRAFHAPCSDLWSWERGCPSIGMWVLGSWSGVAIKKAFTIY